MVLLVWNLNIWACDICSCASGNSNLGILPQFHKHFVGLQYQFRNSQSEIYSLSDKGPKYAKEKFQQIELRGRWNLNRKWQVFYFVPYIISQQEKGITNTNFKGIGDVSALVNYSVINTGDSLYLEWKQNLQVGGGIKLPTGKYGQKGADKLVNPALQQGTGSTDFIVNALYTLRKGALGMNSSIMHRFTGTNKDQFRFGQRTTAQITGFYWAKLENEGTLLPGLGCMMDRKGNDNDRGISLTTHQTFDVSTTFTVDYFIKNWGFHTGFILPVYQKNDDIQVFKRIQTSILYIF